MTTRPTPGGAVAQLITVSVVCHNYVIRQALATCVVAIAEEQRWDLGRRGALLGAFFYGYLLGNPLSGLALQRWSGFRVLVAALLAWSCITAILPVALAVGGFPALWLATAMLGFFEAPMMSASADIMTRLVPIAKRGRAASMLGTGINAGRLVATFTAPALCARLGWRATLYLIALGGVLLVPLFLWRGRAADHPPTPRAATAGATTEGAARKAWMGKMGKVGTGLANTLTRITPLLRQPSLVAVFSVHFLFNASNYFLLSWSPTYFHTELGVPMDELGAVLLPPSIAMVVASLVAGPAMDAMDRRSVFGGNCSMGLPTAGEESSSSSSSSSSKREQPHTKGPSWEARLRVRKCVLCGSLLAVMVLMVKLGLQATDGVSSTGGASFAGGRGRGRSLTDGNVVRMSEGEASFLLGEGGNDGGGQDAYLRGDGWGGREGGAAMMTGLRNVRANAGGNEGVRIHKGRDQNVARVAETVWLWCWLMFFSGVTSVAFNRNYMELAPTPQQAGWQMSIGNTIATVPGAAGPAVVNMLRANGGGWGPVFLFFAFTAVLGAAVFGVWGSVKLRPRRDALSP